MIKFYHHFHALVGVLSLVFKQARESKAAIFHGLSFLLHLRIASDLVRKMVAEFQGSLKHQKSEESS